MLIVSELIPPPVTADPNSVELHTVLPHVR